MLDALATRDAEDINERDRHVLAGWRDAHIRPLMRATRSQAGHDLVPFSDHILNREVRVRESRQVHADELFLSFDPTWRTGRVSVTDEIWGEEVVNGSKILLVEHFLVETAHQGLVVFG